MVNPLPRKTPGRPDPLQGRKGDMNHARQHRVYSSNPQRVGPFIGKSFADELTRSLFRPYTTNWKDLSHEDEA